MQVATFLQRVHDATQTPTLYFLGKGGWPDGDKRDHPHPGEWVSPAACLDDMRARDPAKYRRYEQAAAAAGLSLDAVRQMPRSPACDCTRFVAWALDVPHNLRPDGKPGSFYTGSILDDVASPKPKMFERFDATQPGRAKVGTMLVFARGAGHEVGHIGVVTAVDGNAADGIGRPTRIIHCAPENYLDAPPAGGVRNAIRETEVARFFSFGDARHVIVVSCKRLTA